MTRLLFAGDFHWNAGSSHMIAEYARAALTVGCEVAVSTELSRLDDQVADHLPMVDDVSWATHLVLVFEGRQFLDERRLNLCETIPRSRRIVLDPDAHWGPHVVDGPDQSGGPYGHTHWQELYRQLSDLVLQPRIGAPLPPGAQFFSYFGMPAPYRRPGPAPDASELPYQLQYIGANWWRWQALTAIVEAAAAAHPPLTRMRVCGRWWAGDPHPDHRTATTNVPGWLDRRSVEVTGPVPFGQLVAEMSKAAITPVLVRPLLARQGLLTPRMFETLAAGTMPALPPELSYTTALYGDEIEPFLLRGDPAEELSRLLRDAKRNSRNIAVLQDRLLERFSYPRLLTELIAFTR